MIRRWPSVVAALLLPLVSPAQDDDFGIWYAVNARVGITQKLDAEIQAEWRTFNNAASTEQAFLEAGADYRLTKFISVAGSYRLTEALEDDSEYHIQHKLFLDIKSSLKPGNFTLQLRGTFQTRFRTYFEYVEDKIPDYTARLRFKATYRTPSIPVNPYIYAETWIPLNKEPENFIGKNRFAAGMEYSFSNRHAVEAGYLFQRDYIPRVYDEHIIQLSYNLSF